MAYGMQFTSLNTPKVMYYAPPIPKWFKPELRGYNTLLRHVLYRNFIKMNTFVLVVGSVRTGKSYFALKFAEEYAKAEVYSGKKIIKPSREFDVQSQCSFYILPLLKWTYQNSDSVFVSDEIQLSMNPRQWYDTIHRIMNEFSQIQGFRRNLLIMTLPDISLIDKTLRHLLNYIVETKRQGRVKWYRWQVDHVTGEAMPFYIGHYSFKKPSNKTWQTYEDMKKEFNDKHLKGSIERLEAFIKPKEEITRNPMTDAWGK
jgi:hypothetical protein